MSDKYKFVQNRDAVHQHNLLYSHIYGNVPERLFVECNMCMQAWMEGIDPRFFPCTDYVQFNECEHTWAAFVLASDSTAIAGAFCSDACDYEVEFEQLRQPFIALQPGR
jgi:hypothetical protein